MRVVFVSVVTSLVTALGILVFGATPIAVLCVLLWLGAIFCSYPFFLVLLWLAILLYDVFAMNVLLGQVSSSLTSLPILLLPMDIPYFFTIIYLIIMTVKRPKEIVMVLKENPFLGLYLIVVVASTIIYTPVFGKMAIGEARKFYFHFLFPILTVLLIKTFKDLRRLVLAIYFMAVCTSIIGYVQFIMSPSLDRTALRFVGGQGAFILLLTLFSILIVHTNGMVILNKAADTVMFILFLASVIITQGRSVFLAGTLGLFLLFGLQRNKILFLSKAVAASIVLLMVIVAIFINMPKFEQSFMKLLSGIREPHSDATASWRMEGWRQQLSGLSARELLVGKGLGSYYLWFNKWGGKVTYAPHNAYVQIVLKFGLLGLFVYGLLVFSLFRKIFAARNRLPPGPMRAYIEMSLVNVGAAHAYMTGYDFSLVMLIFYAVGISAVKLLQDVREVDEQHGQGAYQSLVAQCNL